MGDIRVEVSTLQQCIKTLVRPEFGVEAKFMGGSEESNSVVAAAPSLLPSAEQWRLSARFFRGAKAPRLILKSKSKSKSKEQRAKSKEQKAKGKRQKQELNCAFSFSRADGCRGM
jgi:hypothetical protein